jgi:hypothetical protein
MEILTNEQLRITGSVVDSPAWLDVKIMQDVKKAAAGISCTRSCASISGSAAAGDSRVQATCRSMAADQWSNLTGWAAVESSERAPSAGEDVCVRRGNGAQSQQRQHDLRRVWRIRAFLDTKSDKRFSAMARQQTATTAAVVFRSRRDSKRRWWELDGVAQRRMTGDEELSGDGGRLHGYRSIRLEFSRVCKKMEQPCIYR